MKKDQKKNDFDYEQAMGEINKIIESLEKGDIPMGELTEKIEKATGLLKQCKAKIQQTDEDIQKMLDELGD
ncbi:MAG: exodeoxyribonuclease VII small subunit [Paludibacteraceae bacterium]|jgi:exodeoxyribonuclease VII small subunit|nr:exodeoxyribonuclease VII small subunit [Paludibacteraceae bacterium]